MHTHFNIILILFAIHILIYGGGGLTLLLHWKEQNDRSRLVLGLYFLSMAISCINFIATAFLAPAEKEFEHGMLEPYPSMFSFFVWSMLPIYILEVKNPNKTTWGKFFLGISPWSIIAIAFLIWHASIGFATITPLTSFAMIASNIHSTEVQLRIALALIFIPYGLTIFIRTSNWRESSVPQPWFNIVCALTCVVTITFILGMLCRITEAIYIHVAVIDILLCIVLYLEFKVRIPVPEQVYPETELTIPIKTTSELHSSSKAASHIALKLQEIMATGIWQNPDFERDDYCHLVGTNRQYFADAVHALGYENFSDMLNNYRLENLCRLIEQNPKAKTQDLVFQVGFRNKDTANRLFQSKFGQTIASYKREGGG